MRYRVAKYRKGYAVVWYDEKGKRHRRALGEDKWKAHAVASEVVAAVTAPQGPETVGQLVEKYLRETDAISADTLRHHWKGAREAFQNLAPREVTEDFCKAYAATRGRQVKPGTIRKEISIVRSALRKAKIATASYWLPAQPEPRDRRLTRDELEALERACDAPHLWLFVQVARYTAGRAGAILGLRWQQVDFDRRRIDLGQVVERNDENVDSVNRRRKQKRRAVVPLHPNLAWSLALAKSAALTPFVIEYAGQRVLSVKKSFKAACKRAKLTDVSPHVLRHTAASWMAEAGVPMEEIAQFLGHTSPAVTYKVYARYSPDYLQRAARALG